MAELSHEELQQLLETQAEQIRHLQLALAQREIGDPTAAGSEGRAPAVGCRGRERNLQRRGDAAWRGGAAGGGEFNLGSDGGGAQRNGKG